MLGPIGRGLQIAILTPLALFPFSGERQSSVCFGIAPAEMTTPPSAAGLTGSTLPLRGHCGSLTPNEAARGRARPGKAQGAGVGPLSPARPQAPRRHPDKGARWGARGAEPRRGCPQPSGGPAVPRPKQSLAEPRPGPSQRHKRLRPAAPPRGPSAPKLHTPTHARDADLGVALRTLALPWPRRPRRRPRGRGGGRQADAVHHFHERRRDRLPPSSGLSQGRPRQGKVCAATLRRHAWPHLHSRGIARQRPAVCVPAGPAATLATLATSI